MSVHLLLAARSWGRLFQADVGHASGIGYSNQLMRRREEGWHVHRLLITMARTVPRPRAVSSNRIKAKPLSLHAPRSRFSRHPTVVKQDRFQEGILVQLFSTAVYCRQCSRGRPVGSRRSSSGAMRLPFNGVRRSPRIRHLPVRRTAEAAASPRFSRVRRIVAFAVTRALCWYVFLCLPFT